MAESARGRGFGKEPMKRAELYAVERGCTDAFLDTSSVFKCDLFILAVSTDLEWMSSSSTS